MHARGNQSAACTASCSSTLRSVSRCTNRWGAVRNRSHGHRLHRSTGKRTLREVFAGVRWRFGRALLRAGSRCCLYFWYSWRNQAPTHKIKKCKRPPKSPGLSGWSHDSGSMGPAVPATTATTPVATVPSTTILESAMAPGATGPAGTAWGALVSGAPLLTAAASPGAASALTVSCLAGASTAAGSSALPSSLVAAGPAPHASQRARLLSGSSSLEHSPLGAASAMRFSARKEMRLWSPRH